MVFLTCLPICKKTKAVDEVGVAAVGEWPGRGVANPPISDGSGVLMMRTEPS